MNIVMLSGRMVRNPERKEAASGAMVTFTVAVDRPKRKDGSQETDFIRCVAFGKTAESIGAYFVKAKPIMIQGRIQVSSYEGKDGEKKSRTEVLVDRFEFVPVDTTKETAPAGAVLEKPAGYENDMYLF